MLKFLKGFIRFALYFIGFYLLYVLIVLLHGTWTDYQPEQAIQLDIQNKKELNPIADSTLSFLIWNVGYGGLGTKCNFFYTGGGFFYSGGKMVRPSKPIVEENIAGAAALLQKQEADFFLLQEIDYGSKRSYYINQFDQHNRVTGQLPASYAPNYKVYSVPVPIFEPWKRYGQTNSGLATFSRFMPSSSTRLQLPGEYGWPKRIFQLDRCLALSRFPLAQSEKELVVINIHNSAFDKGGVLKMQQMEYLKELILGEYAKGNYVVAGGDWNQCPPYFKYNGFFPTQEIKRKNANIAADLLPEGWQWVYDPTVPTVRSTRNIYKPGESFVTLIDFFLISPNLRAVKVKGIDHQFKASDHQPVWMEIELL